MALPLGGTGGTCTPHNLGWGVQLINCTPQNLRKNVVISAGVEGIRRIASAQDRKIAYTVWFFYKKNAGIRYRRAYNTLQKDRRCYAKIRPERIVKTTPPPRLTQVSQKMTAYPLLFLTITLRGTPTYFN